MTKSQKIIVVLNAFWVILGLCITASEDYEDCLFESRIAQFFILSSPILLYWAGVWIWGWGYIFKYKKLIFNTIKCLSILFFMIVFIRFIYEIQQDLIFPTKIERLHGCILPSDSQNNKTCFNGKAYYNPLLKDIINRRPYAIIIHKHNKRYSIKSNNGCAQLAEFCFTPKYDTENLRDSLWFQQIKELRDDLIKSGYGEVFEMLELDLNGI